jgi:radical SAM superfamily enzyme YgiQ (UPF0313 family)
MKIRLVEPPAPSMHMWSYSTFPRLGLPMIGAALKAAGHDVRIYCALVKGADWEDVRSADLVGLSTTTSTAHIAYEMADALRARGVPTIIGGSHVTFMADEGLAHADYIARGEGGEALMLELIEALRGERTLESIGGLSFRRDGQSVHNPLRPAAPDLDHLPVPDLTLVDGHEGIRTTPIMTSWGCPFDCNFCSVTAMFGRKYRFRSPEHVVAEIRDKRPRAISFYDDNFAANRARLKTLLRMMIDEQLVVPWTAQVRADVARDPELLDLMRAAGCETLALGLESVSQETLDRFEKSQSVEDIVLALREITRRGIRVHGMFVLGADSDGPRVARDTVDFARANGIAHVMLNILTPLPGTLQFEELDAAGRIHDKRWRYYDAQHTVFLPKQMSPAQLQSSVFRAYLRFYSTRRWLADLFSLNWTKVKVNSWFWWFVRSWWRDRRNRVYARELRDVPWPPADLPRGHDRVTPAVR